MILHLQPSNIPKVKKQNSVSISPILSVFAEVHESISESICCLTVSNCVFDSCYVCHFIFLLYLESRGCVGVKNCCFETFSHCFIITCEVTYAAVLWYLNLGLLMFPSIVLVNQCQLVVLLPVDGLE